MAPLPEAGTNLGNKALLGMTEESPADGPQNPRSGSPGQVWLPSLAICLQKPGWTRLRPLTPPIITQTPLLLAGAAPTAASAQSALKKIFLWHAFPNTQPQLPAR